MTLGLSLRRGLRAFIVLASLSAALPMHASSVLLPGAKPSSQQRLSVWGFDVYDARLWIRPGFSVPKYADHSFVLELSYLRNLEGAAIAKTLAGRNAKSRHRAKRTRKHLVESHAGSFPQRAKG
jgi:hypothetical protein